MAEQRLTMQDLIRRRQAERFVGRRDELSRWVDNLALSIAERSFLFCVHGDAGVGKTFLVRHLATVAREHGFSTGYVDESSYDLPTALEALTADLAGQGVRCKQSIEKLADYRRRQRELDSDPGAPEGMSSLLAKSAIRVGLRAAGDLPVVGAAVRDVDSAALAEQVDRLRVYLNRKFRDHEDVRLLLSPVDVLTPVFVEDLNAAAERAPVALFFDTYERTGEFLDLWLRELLAGRFGDLPANLVLTLAGRHPLDVNRWSDYLGVQTELPLTVFSAAEARQLLAERGVTDARVTEVILGLSGRLPLLVALLAEGRPDSIDRVGDRSGDAVERFLKWESDEDRRAAARHGALPRRLDAEVFGVATGSTQPDFDWLRRLPFVVEHTDGYRYHDVVRQAMLRFTRRLAPGDWTRRHLALAEHYHAAAVAMGLSEDACWYEARWRDLTLEEHYHRLCAEGTTALPAALAGFADAFAQHRSTAHRWGQLITQAGTDSDLTAVREKGERLSAFTDDDPDTQLRVLTGLVADPSLDAEHQGTTLAERGEIHRVAGRFDEALADFNRALELRPDYAWAIASRGQVHAHLGQNEEAVDDLDRAIDLRPSLWWALVTRAQIHAPAGRHDAALTDLNRALELRPDNDWIIAERGETYREMGRHDDALADFDRAISLDPNYVWAIVSRGQTYAQLGRYDEAFADFDRALELRPDADWILTIRGMIRRDRGDYAEALVDLTRAIETGPDFDVAVTARGRLYRMTEHYDRAIADFDRALEIDPDDTWTLAQRGETYTEMGRHDEALADFTRALALSPDDDWIIADRGRAYRMMGQYDRAIADFTRAIEIDPTYDWAMAQRGEAYRLTARYDDAVADFTRAIEVDPDYVWAIAGRGQAHRLAGRHHEALADFSRAIVLSPDSDWIVAERGETYRVMERYDEALVDLTRAVELDPRYDWAYALRGDTYRLMDRYDEAVADLDRAVAIDPEYAWAIGSRGQVHQARGEYDRALSDFGRAIEINAEYAWAIAQRGETYRLMQRYDEALADFTRAIEIEPDYEWAIGSRGQTHRQAGAVDAALADFDRVCATTPGTGWWFYEAALIQFGRGERTRATEHLRSALAVDAAVLDEHPGEFWRATNTVLYLLALGEADEAHSRLRAILDHGETTKDITEGMAELAELHDVMGVDVEEAQALMRSHADRQR